MPPPPPQNNTQGQWQRLLTFIAVSTPQRSFFFMGQLLTIIVPFCLAFILQEAGLSIDWFGVAFGVAGGVAFGVAGGVA
ncbi:MAG: hypothetical protein GY805_16900, partial [Chloroflexi bacterium]|nr:hypothetical protein [Chloroflexota bacterium]